MSSLRPAMVYDAAAASQQLGDLTTGRAFDNNCVCPGDDKNQYDNKYNNHDDMTIVNMTMNITDNLSATRGSSNTCVCGARRLAPEQHFVQVRGGQCGDPYTPC